MNQDKLKTTGVFGVGTDEMKTVEVRKVEGESATLHSGVEEYHQITWMLGPRDRNIARCRGNINGTRSCEITDERLRDRLKIDNQTGSLTIIIISTELAGLYKLQVIDNFHKNLPDKKFNVTVFAPLPVPTIVKDSEKSSSQCVLLCSVMNVTNATLCWYKGNSLISTISVADLNNSVSLFLEVNDQDFNDYSCVLNNSISNQTKHLNITELGQPCHVSKAGPERDHTGLKWGLGLGLGLLVLGLGLLVLDGVVTNWSRCRNPGRNGVDGRYDVKRETVSMINSCSDEEGPAGIDEELQPNSDTCVNIH